jgi:hypothetical protein
MSLLNVTFIVPRFCRVTEFLRPHFRMTSGLSTTRPERRKRRFYVYQQRVLSACEAPPKARTDYLKYGVLAVITHK